MAAPSSGVATSAPGTPAAAPPTRAASIVVGGVRFTAPPTMAGAIGGAAHGVVLAVFAVALLDRLEVANQARQASTVPDPAPA